MIITVVSSKKKSGDHSKVAYLEKKNYSIVFLFVTDKCFLDEN
jgi:hypothetical protein